MRDWVQGGLIGEIGLLQEISLLGRGFFQLEFDSEEAARQALARSPLRFEDRLMFIHPGLRDLARRQPETWDIQYGFDSLNFLGNM